MPMRSLALELGLAVATPALAVEMTITVEGEANGAITIDLLEEVAPNHVAQIRTLAEQGAYDNVVFHRVIDGFMAQNGDVEFGKLGADMRMAGRGGSDLPIFRLSSRISRMSVARSVWRGRKTPTARILSSLSCLSQVRS